MDRWSQLSLKDKSDLMSLYIKNGITSLDKMKEHYNSFATGGQMNTDGHLFYDGGTDGSKEDKKKDNPPDLGPNSFAMRQIGDWLATRPMSRLENVNTKLRWGLTHQQQAFKKEYDRLQAEAAKVEEERRAQARQQADEKLRADLSGKNGFWTMVGAGLTRAGDPLTSGSPSIIADDANRLEAVGLEDEANKLRQLSTGIGITGLFGLGFAAAPMATTASLGLGYGVDKGTQLLSNNKYTGWGNMLAQNIGGPELLWDLTNPGYFVGGWGFNRFAKSGLGRALELSRELNKGIRNATLTTTPIKDFTHNRFRLGDVEIDNPNLMYHVDNGDYTGFSGNGAYVKDRILFPSQHSNGQKPYTWWNLGRPYRNGQTRLFVTTKDNPSLLRVRDQDYPIGQWTGNPKDRTFVTNQEYVSSEPVQVRNEYKLDPNYGYRRIQEPIPTLEQVMQEVKNARIEVPEVLSAREPFEMSNIPNWREIFSNYNPNTTRTVRTTTQSTEFNPSIFDFNKGNTDTRFEFFEPWKFINYDLTKMSTDEVVKTFGPGAKHLKELYDVAAANNFEGKYADIAKDVELKLSKMFAIDPKDVDIAAGLARAKGIYNIPEYTERFKKYGDLGETFIQDAKNRLDNIQLQGVSRNFKITGQYGVEGGASTAPHPIQPTITLSNNNRSSVIREFMTHEANHAAHGTRYQPKWMEVHNEKIRPVPKKNRKDFTNFDKYLDEMDELVERSKTAVEYANETRLEGETLDQALDRVFEAANKDVYNSEMPSDIRQMVKNYTKDSVLKFWKQFLGGIALPTYISTRNEG